MKKTVDLNLVNAINVGTDDLTEANIENNDNEATNVKNRESFGSKISTWILWLFCITLICLRFAGFGIGEVVGSSMEPTFSDGDKFFSVHATSENIDYKDVVVIKSNGKIIIKRVLGKPGDLIFIDEEGLHVNDVLEVPDGYTTAGYTYPYDTVFPIVLGEDEYFILGDNRENSLDSRFTSVGVINLKKFYGKVAYRKSPNKFKWTKIEDYVE